MGFMNITIGSLGIIVGLLIFILTQEIISPIALIILGIVFLIFNQKEEEFERRNDEKINNNDN
jgi:hypothetical protein